VTKLKQLKALNKINDKMTFRGFYSDEWEDLGHKGRLQAFSKRKVRL
jgi:hypothetical protein